jgi:hypothetical protein
MAGRRPWHPGQHPRLDYWAGGRDHYRPDRELADRITKICPGPPRMARDNREFTGRAVARAAREGIAQFLDLGSGYSLGTEIHDIARTMKPAASAAGVLAGSGACDPSYITYLS